MSMTPSPRAIEAAIKAIRDLRKARKAALPFMPYGTSKPIMDKDLAETAITAYLAALSVDGVALAPIDPTQAMLDAASTATSGCGCADHDYDDDIRAQCAAMLAAASDQEERE